MIQDILSSIICREYEKNFKMQNWNRGSELVKAMEITINLNLDYEKEEGYRELKILIFNEYNYVSVFAKLLWNVVKSGRVEVEREDELKPGIEGSTPFVHFSAHDTCWCSDGIERIIHLFRNRLNCLEGFGSDWYKVRMLEESEVRDFCQVSSDTRNGQAPHASKFTEMEFKFPAEVV